MISKLCMRVGLDDGTSIVCSTDHKLLVCPRSADRGGWRWAHAQDLRLGHKLRAGVPPVDPGVDYDSGWMGGFLDGEGYVGKNGGMSKEGDAGFGLGWSQKPGDVHNQACAIMTANGFDGFGVSAENGGTYKDVLTAKCGQWPALGALMRFRPVRLLAKKPWLGATIPAEKCVKRIVSLGMVGEREVVALKTSTHTFIAEGVCSHNSAFNAKFDKGKMEQVPVEDMRVYAGGDTDACYQVADLMQRELDEQDEQCAKLKLPSLKKFYTTILHPAARAFEKIERRGILIDQEKYAVLREDLRKAIKIEQNKRADTAAVKMQRKYKDRIDEQTADGKNPLLPSILSEYFFSPSGFNLKPKDQTPKTGHRPRRSASRQFASTTRPPPRWSRR